MCDTSTVMPRPLVPAEAFVFTQLRRAIVWYVERLVLNCGWCFVLLLFFCVGEGERGVGGV